MIQRIFGRIQTIAQVIVAIESVIDRLDLFLGKKRLAMKHQIPKAQAPLTKRPGIGTKLLKLVNRRLMF